MKHQPLNNPYQETKLFQTRLILVVGLVLGCFALLLIRLFYLQIIKYHYYNDLSLNNSISLQPIAPPRGLIYDRNGILLADNTPVYSLDIIPDQTDNLDKTVTDLQHLLNIDPDDVDRFYKQLDENRPFDSIPLKVKLTDTEVAIFYVNKFRFPGVNINVRLIRNYPYHGDFVSAIGYAGRISLDELRNLNPDVYNGIDYIGKSGLEKEFEDNLRGQAGYNQVQTNAQGQALQVLKEIPPVPGENLYLTIDAPLQEAAVKAMGNYRGAIVAIDPSNGQVLAMVSNPGFDPNDFVRGVPQKEYAELRNDPAEPLFNRTIRGQYPPASTVKPILGLEGLDKGFVTPEFKIYDPGYFQLTSRSRKYRNWRREGQGWMDLHAAIAQSCDTYFYYLSNKMGIADITEVLSEFGYGQITGIEMPDELPGVVPSPTSKKKLTDQPWYPGDTLNTSIGQGLSLVTPLQLAVAVATIANRGVHYKPTLILKWTDPHGKLLSQSTPQITNKIEFKDSTWDVVIGGMRGVIIDPQGTGYRFGNPAYTVAAKTGTGQLFTVGQNEKYVDSKVAMHLRDNAMFIAFAPVNQPKIAIAVVTQNNHEAAGIARQVVDYYLLTEKHLYDNDVGDEDRVGKAKLNK